MTNTTNTPDLRAALIEARDWFESQAKAVSKGCWSSYELHDLRVQRDALDAALAAPAQAATAKQSPHPEYDKGFSDGWNRCEARQAAAPAQAARAAQAEPEDLSVAYFMGLHAENETLHVENDTLRAGYDAARLEIEGLQAQAQQCGTGAGCCAQAARIEELEAQLEAVGAGGVSALMAAPNGGQLVPVEPTKEMVIEAYEAQGEATSSACEEIYRAMLAAAPQPPAQAQEDAPDMFWDADDTENFAHEVQDIVDGYCSGEIVTIECAKRMPNFRVLITGEGDSLSYEHIDAASAAQQGGKA